MISGEPSARLEFPPMYPNNLNWAKTIDPGGQGDVLMRSSSQGNTASPSAGLKSDQMIPPPFGSVPETLRMRAHRCTTLLVVRETKK